MRIYSALILLILGFGPSWVSAQETMNFAHGSVGLNLVQSRDPKSAPRVTVSFDIEPGWHIYGQNPGEVGLPTEIKLGLPVGLKSSALNWPDPETFSLGGLKSFGYERQVEISSDLFQKSYVWGEADKVVADLSWAVCRDECIPGTGHLARQVPQGIAFPEVASLSAFNLTALSSLALSILMALVGGLLLNLMPCVFPVISIKILGFLEQKEQGSPLKHAWYFSAGVIVSFWALAAGLLGLRAAGEQLGWGFQFQSPGFVAVIAIVLFAVALNLLGVFEVGSSLQNMAGRKDRKSGLFGAFLSGVLATAVATPCTAPLMGTAVATALALPWLSCLLIFTALGLGMSSPYLLLSAYPKWLSWLPRPGNWMVTFKQLLAFPLLASVVWLLWVLRMQVSSTDVTRIELAMVLFGFGLWIFGKLYLPSSSNRVRRYALVTASCTVLATFYLGWPGSAQSIELGKGALSAAENSQGWQQYSPALLKELRDKGKPVLLDVTAAWCLVCQANHQLVFSSKNINQELRARGVTLLKADWTNKDTEITKLLHEFGRDGVPLNVAFGTSDEPIVLPSLLSSSGVLKPFEHLPKVGP